MSARNSIKCPNSARTCRVSGLREIQLSVRFAPRECFARFRTRDFALSRFRTFAISHFRAILQGKFVARIAARISRDFAGAN